MQGLATARTNADGRIVVCQIGELRPHSSYERLQLRASSAQISALAALAGPLEPLVITHDGVVIDGYARLELARQRRTPSLTCLEYQLDQDEALLRILQTHRRLNGFNAFTRIALALELEPFFQTKAIANQKHGGRHKGSSILAEAERVDVRDQIAKTAGASTGNVTKVRQILAAAHEEVLAAVRTGEVRIHRAWQWCESPHKTQLELLFQFRTEKGIKKTIHSLISKYNPPKRTQVFDAARLSACLSRLVASGSEPIRVEVLKGAGERVLFVSEDLIDSLDIQPGLPLE